jgi:hypothetical protein
MKHMKSGISILEYESRLAEDINKMYHEHGLGQGDIARRTELSRKDVSLYLRNGKGLKTRFGGNPARNPYKWNKTEEATLEAFAELIATQYTSRNPLVLKEFTDRVKRIQQGKKT